MKTLLLWRHAQAQYHANDFARELTAKGLRQASDMAHQLQEQEAIIDQIFCSTARRTQQTVAALLKLQPALASALQLSDDLYECDMARIVSVIAQAEETSNSLLVVAHNPSLSMLAQWLVQEAYDCSLYPGDLVQISLPITQWSELTAKSSPQAKVMLPQE